MLFHPKLEGYDYDSIRVTFRYAENNEMEVSAVIGGTSKGWYSTGNDPVSETDPNIYFVTPSTKSGASYAKLRLGKFMLERQHTSVSLTQRFAGWSREQVDTIAHGQLEAAFWVNAL